MVVKKVLLSSILKQPVCLFPDGLAERRGWEGIPFLRIRKKYVSLSSKGFEGSFESASRPT